MALAGCATVRSEDTEAWIGQPAVVLDKQPMFLTMLVRTSASDGTEIRNYVNGRNVSACGGGSVFVGTLSFANYNTFTSCMQNVAACNNIFYIKDGHVERMVLIGTAGLRCYTDARFQHPKAP